MSFNRLNYDTCAYKKNLNESTGPCNYQLNRPSVSCEPCYPNSPASRLQKNGGSILQNQSLIDTDSELIGISRKNSKCPTQQYIPTSSNTATNNHLIQRQSNLIHYKDCYMPSEDTRFSNPVSTLRGTGFNRWEWLCHDPQENIFNPFEYNINNRLIVKDNHRPIIPKPLDPYQLPDTGDIPCEKTISSCAAATF